MNDGFGELYPSPKSRINFDRNNTDMLLLTHFLVFVGFAFLVSAYSGIASRSTAGPSFIEHNTKSLGKFGFIVSRLVVLSPLSYIYYKLRLPANLLEVIGAIALLGLFLTFDILYWITYLDIDNLDEIEFIIRIIYIDAPEILGLILATIIVIPFEIVIDFLYLVDQLGKMEKPY